MTIARILGNYPPLFHYTYENKLMSLLNSKSLLVKPIWDFQDDTQEYVLGLKLIEKKLKSLEFSTRILPLEEPVVSNQLIKYCGNLKSVVDRTIAHIEYEIKNYNDPRMQVYVACFSTTPFNRQMAQQYGSAFIAFNPLIPLVAYQTPEPFITSMISRVTYDNRNFEQMMLASTFRWILQRIDNTDKFLSSLPPDELRDCMGVSFAEHLCLFAPNIKHHSFSYENEWRLKSVISTHNIKSVRTIFRIPETDGTIFAKHAEVANQFDPKRFFHKLTIMDKFISLAVNVKDASLAKEVNTWLHENSMHITDMEDAINIASQIDELIRHRNPR